jgi:hypothetical protein
MAEAGYSRRRFLETTEMTKYWLVGATAFAMMSGAAFAQGVTTDSTVTQSTTAANPAPVGTYTATRTQQAVDANGNAVVQKKSYTSGPNGTSETDHTKVEAPDGSTTTYHSEHTTAAVPAPADTTTTRSMTTTTTAP